MKMRRNSVMFSLKKTFSRKIMIDIRPIYGLVLNWSNI